MLDDPFFIHQRRRSSPEIISVPIHFFSSAQPPTPSPAQKESAALKIQKLFRGFLVRKSVNKISSIRNEVCKVESSINSTEIGELIRLDAKERLRVNETLMSLLFVLDSIRGVDFGVREFRRAVIKEAIALQEKVDLIEVTSEQVIELESSSCLDHVIDVDLRVDSESGVCDFRKSVIEKAIVLQEKVDLIVPDRNKSDEIVSEIVCESEITSEQVLELESSSSRDQVIDADNPLNLSTDTDCVSVTVIDATMEVEKEIGVNCDYAVENSENRGEGMNDKNRNIRFLEKVDSIVPDKNQSDATGSVIVCESEITSQLVLELEPFSSRDLVIDADNSMNLATDTDSVMKAACVTVKVIDSSMEVEKEIDVNCDYAVENTEASGKETDDKKRDIRFLEKLIDDNEKMMKVMTQMFETNEMQTRMMNSLRKRVERLEKAFICDKHRKKKKMNHSA